MKNRGELKIYTGYAFVRDWDSGVVEMNQTAYAENLVAQYGISATSNIPGSPGVDLGPRKDGEPGGNDEGEGVPWFEGAYNSFESAVTFLYIAVIFVPYLPQYRALQMIVVHSI